MAIGKAESEMRGEQSFYGGVLEPRGPVKTGLREAESGVRTAGKTEVPATGLSKARNTDIITVDLEL